MLERVSFLGFSEPISSLSHLITALFFLFVGTRVFLESRGNSLKSSSLFLYLFCGVFLFSMSGVYHLLEKGSDANYVLQILDHAGIYLMISGSLTPFHIILLRRFKRWAPLVIIWTLAITGLVLTSIFFSTMPESLILTFFISMGWMSLYLVWHIRNIDPTTNKLIFIGGMFYTVGAVADFLRWPNIITGILEAHEVFHIFISIAAIVHFFAVARVVKFPISDELTLVVKRYPDYVTASFLTENMTFQASTVDEVKSLAKEWVKEQYLPVFYPTQIQYKYFDEEVVKLELS